MVHAKIKFGLVEGIIWQKLVLFVHQVTIFILPKTNYVLLGVAAFTNLSSCDGYMYMYRCD